MRRAARLGLSLLSVVGLIAALLAYAATHAPPHSSARHSVRADAALVLSGDVDYLRVERAVALLAEGAVGALVLTGAGVGGDSARELRNRAERLGAPPQKLHVETTSTSTRENLLHVRPLVRDAGWKRVALVTNEFHMGRAERVARKVMPEVEWVAVPVRDPGSPARLRGTRLTEWAKLLWYRLRGWA